MSKILPMFANEYRGHFFTIDFTQQQNGITARMQIDEEPWHENHVDLWRSYDEARNDSVAVARQIIDKMVGK